MTIEEMMEQEIEWLEGSIYGYAKSLEKTNHPLGPDCANMRIRFRKEIEEVLRLRKILSYWQAENLKLQSRFSKKEDDVHNDQK